MGDPETAPVAPPAGPETVFLDLADWRGIAKQDREKAAGFGVSWTPSKQEVRLALDVPAEQSDYVRDFVITTGETDRHGDYIDLAGWDWTSYFLGGDGVVLFAHDRRGVPMGACPWIKAMGPALVGRCRFPTQAEVGYAEDEPSFWKTIRLMYVNGFMKNTSVGFMPDEWTWDEKAGGLHFIKQTGLEWSLVSVPANAGCFQLAKSAGIDIDPLRQWAMRSLDNLGGIEGVYVSKAKLEAVLKSLGSEKGLKHFDLGEILSAKAPPAKAEGTEESVEQPVPEKARKKGFKNLLMEAGIGIEDLIATVRAAKFAPVAVTEIVSPAADLSEDAEVYLDIADEVVEDGLVLVDEAGKSVEVTREGLTALLRTAFQDAYDTEHTRVTGKVF